MSDTTPYEPKTTLSIEEAAKNLVNAIADCIHSALQARDAVQAEKERITAQESTDLTKQPSEDKDIENAIAEAQEQREAEEREEREAQAAQAALTAKALEAVDRRVPNGQRVSLAGQGRGRTYGEGALPQEQFYIKGAKIGFPDSLRTAIATIFREELAVTELSNITLNGDDTVRYSAVRNTVDGRQITLTCNQFRQEIAMSIDDLAEEEVPL